MTTVGRCPACRGVGKRPVELPRILATPPMYIWTSCHPCGGHGRIVIVPPAEAQLGGVCMSLSEAKRVIAEKRVARG